MDELLARLFEVQVVRFIGVGVASTLLYYSIFTPLIRRVHYLLAAAVAFVPAFVFAFYFHKLWTFENETWATVWEQLALYSLKKAVFFGLNALLLSYLVEYKRLRALHAQLVTTGILGLGSFFVTQWIFRH